jgi:hypothetical protein
MNSDHDSRYSKAESSEESTVESSSESIEADSASVSTMCYALNIAVNVSKLAEIPFCL